LEEEKSSTKLKATFPKNIQIPEGTYYSSILNDNKGDYINLFNPSSLISSLSFYEQALPYAVPQTLCHYLSPVPSLDNCTYNQVLSTPLNYSGMLYSYAKIVTSGYNENFYLGNSIPRIAKYIPRFPNSATTICGTEITRNIS